ncbi:DUF2813 domain-containing protein [Butyricicoccus sp.]|uniref:ATP-binding protein n=1 Tax=Butyricicoccus sp. TaxID=2049021 RepID=UPI003D7D74EC
MKTIRLNRLEIENFKGIRQLTLNLNGRSASIYGNNATGKTTVYDALTWLLFGKDSHGNTKFSVKPLDASGNTYAGIMPTVTGELDIDGAQITLRKQLREKWEKHRGGTERYAGNTVDHYINDVPTKEKDYKTRVSELVDEDVFRMLTSAHRFCKDVRWQDRRKVLFDLAGIVSDDVLLADPAFTELRGELDGRSVDDYRAMLNKQRKDANGALNLLPARIDECEGQLDTLPVSFDSAARDALERQLSDLRGQLAAMDNAEARNAKRNEIREQELKLHELNAENEMHRRSQDVPVIDERPAVQQEIERLLREKAAAESEIERLKAANEMSDARLADYRKRWSVEHKKVYKPGICTTCGQPLPPDMDAAAHRKFDADKKATQDALVADSQIIKDQAKSNSERIAELDDRLCKIAAQIETRVAQFSEMKAPKPVHIEDLPDYEARCTEIQQRITALKGELTAWDEHMSAEKDKLRAQICDAEQQKAEQDTIASQVQLRKGIESRIAELEDERHAKAAFIEHVDAMLELCEQFVQQKVERVSDAVNEKFRLVTFRLFTEAINGSLQDCCDAIVNGVPYNDLNSAMQINAGLDCIETLSDFYNVHVPLFVDNAESVTNLYNVDTQVIRLVVSENDEELRCEV